MGKQTVDVFLHFWTLSEILMLEHEDDQQLKDRGVDTRVVFN